MKLTMRAINLLLCLTSSMFLAVSCVAKGNAVHDTSASHETGAAAHHATAAKAASVQADTSTSSAHDDEDDLFAKEPVPLKPVQCGQCHEGIYNKLRNNGGKHKFVCSNCHETFHSYNPVKKNWNEIMPKCANCHDEPHGARFTECLKCHQEPHTPLMVPYNNYLISECGNCHTGPAGQLRKYPSAHTEQGCDACHQSHGQIPSCFECHEPHIPNQPLEACKACHPVHKPLQITYGKGNAQTCSACHSGVYDEWSHTKSKHGKVDCADCHTRHGEIPKCQRCHGQPHNAGILAQFPNCLDCHINVHDLPTN